MNKVLVVEDEANQRLLYRVTLEAEGFEVLLAKDCQEAHVLLESKSPDVVVVDVVLPGPTGIELAEGIAENHQEVAIIINTGYGEFRQDFRCWVADAFLVKSSDVQPLIDTIRGLLKQKPPPETGSKAVSSGTHPASKRWE